MKREPLVNVPFQRLNSLQRVAESFRHVALSTEHWISPNGSLRRWMKANTRFAVLIAAPTFMVFPVITMALWEVSSWVNSLTAIAAHFIVLPVLALLALINIAIVFRIIGMFSKR